ncbi:MAG: DNA polymerase III subunit beta [Salinisphaeraceae bacterium]|nr:DNA polymerase III subunit beta [Salinisphaeraceae bacterium]
MKFKVARLELLEALQAVIGVVERRQTMPILSNVLIQAENDRVKLTATDLELEMVTQFGAAVTQPGSVTIPARKLLDICRGLPDGADISLEQQEQRIKVSSGRSRFTLSGLAANEFPFLDDIGAGTEFDISQKALKRLLDRTQFAMAHQDVRYYLNGLLLAVRQDQIRCVATDGHRLAMCDVSHETGVEELKEVIVPRKAITELLRLLGNSDLNIRISLSDNHLQANLPDVRITTKLIDGRFPDYERVIPSAGDKLAMGDRELVKQALSRTAILSNEKFRGVRLGFEDGKMRLQAQNPDQEEAEDELEIEYQGEPLEIGFNVNYLIDALGAMDSEQFAIELTGSDSSGLLKEVGDDSSRYVVMPMRL